MEHMNGWCFRGIYKGGLWEEDLHVSARLTYIESIAAENKYLEKRENKQIIPSLIDFMRGRFYIVNRFTKRFHCSADFAFQTRSQSVFTE